MEKSRDFQLFMTQNDEQQFCEELRGYNPNIFFLDISPSSEADISKRLYTFIENTIIIPHHLQDFFIALGLYI